MKKTRGSQQSLDLGEGVQRVIRLFHLLLKFSIIKVKKTQTACI